MDIDAAAMGYDNIKMRSIMLGLSHRQVQAIMPDVQKPSQLGEFLGLPTRTYSSGMMLWPAFAISTAVHPDTLALDEVIGVGEAAFAERAEQRLYGMIQKASIMFLALQDNNSIKRFCNRMLSLKSGAFMMDGPPDDVLAAYAANGAP